MPPALVVPARVAVAQPRRPGWVSGAWAARALTGPPGIGLLAAPWLAANTALAPREALACGLGVGAVGSVANARRRGSRRRTEARMRAWRASRGELADLYPIDDVLPSEEGVWRLGATTDPGPRGDYELQWRPWDGDPPHLLIAGSTGGGKSEAGRLILASALRWGWDVEIIDLKGSTEYHPLPVHETTAAARDCLARVMADTRRRGALLRDTVREVTGPDGRLYDGRPRNFRQVPEELRAGLRSRLVLIDEAALLRLASTSEPAAGKAGAKAVEFLQAATALVRSLGIHLVILVQRPDADLLPGFLRNNVQARMLFGPNDQEAELMTIGPAAVTASVLESDVRVRPPGRCLAVDVGGPGARLAHGYLLHEAALLRALDAAEPAESPAHADASGGPPVDGPLDAPGASAPRSSGPSGDLGYLPSRLRPGASIFDAPPAAPLGSSAPAPSVPSSLGSSSSGRLRGPCARAALRCAAWRLLVGPLRPALSERPFGLRSLGLSRRRPRCAACRAKGQVEVDHRRPRWACGSDRPRNLWLLCARCHGAKSREEAIVRKWRRRASPRVLARVPAWAWALVGAMALGALGLGSPIALILAALVVVDCLILMTQRSGLDGRNTLDARLEQMYGGPIALGSRIATGTMAGVNTVRLVLGGLGASYLAGFMLAVWW